MSKRVGNRKRERKGEPPGAARSGTRASNGGKQDPTDEKKSAARPEGVPVDALVRVFRVAPEHAGTRVDVFLSSQLRNTSRTRAKLIAENGAYRLDGRRRRPSERLAADERVVIWRSPFEELDDPTDIEILYEDEHLLVVDKPPLLAVHPTARHHNVTVIRLLQEQRPGERLSLIHRLDRETSGILLIARTRDSDRAFKRLFEARRAAGTAAQVDTPIDKTYLAITWGVPDSGLIDLPVERDEKNPLRVKMKTVSGRSGLDARTEVKVLDQTAAYALVECRLHTGRQHQIRVHLSAVGCPVVGDKLYGPDERLLARGADGELTEGDLELLELPRHALHAHRYGLPHAITGEALRLVSPLAPDLSAFWQWKAGHAPPGRPNVGLRR